MLSIGATNNLNLYEYKLDIKLNNVINLGFQIC